MPKIKLAILLGGRSAEHEVSLRSAANVIKAIDKEKYDLTLVGIDKLGRWFLIEDSSSFLGDHFPESLKYADDNAIVFVPGEKGKIEGLKNKDISFKVDVVFPVLHGTFGEDGTVQGLLKLADVPFVGPGVLGSAVGMDKDAMKRLLRDAGLPIAKFLVFEKGASEIPKFEEIKAKLGDIVFVKPANLGSSVGVSKVRTDEDFQIAVKDAYRFDNKIIVEENITGKEVECSVLGNEKPVAGAVGEVIPRDDFYSYNAKYIDENGAVLKIPAEISNETAVKVQEAAIKTFKALCCEGMGRVDCFLKENGDVVVNEINTIPGFTSISMYPKLLEEIGIKYPDLIDKLIDLAFERYEKENSLKRDFD
ncbi:MAG: D-alanine--D-alanine ligase [Candidatus Moraniibacteriota bacterium]